MAPDRDDTDNTDDNAEADSRPEGTRLVAVRRRPQLSRFLVVGGIIGFVLGVVVVWRGPEVQGSTPLQQYILLGAIGAVFASFFGAILYLVLDRLSLRD